MNARNLTAFLLVLMSFQGFSQKYKGDSWAKIKSGTSGTLTVVYVEQFGLIYKDRDGKIKGVCADILSDFTKYIKDKYGKSIRVNYAGEEPIFSNFLNAVQTTPDILGVTNTTITEERKKIFKFSPPFMLNRLVMLTHSSVPAVSSLKELPGKLPNFSAQVIEGSTHVEYIQKIKSDYMPSLKVSYETNGPVIIKNLVANPKLFTIIDLTEFIEAAHKKLPIKRHPVEIGIVEELGFIMSHQSDWDVPFKEFLTADYKSSMRYKQIISENISASFMSLVK
jgi:ABC-type amino acid transport substrate-binding protein